MSVHYKFKSALEYDTVTFDGLHISVKDLKNAIIQQKRIGKSTDFDLQVTNAQTKEVYDDENALIPKNTSLLIARLPVTVQKQKQWEGYGGDNTPPAKVDEGGPIAKAVDLSSLDAPEDDKIKAMMSQSTQEYDPSNYIKIRGANQMGAVPPNYKCYKCHQGGHWIKDCTFGQGTDPVEIKKSTGIPKSFMVPVDGPQVPGAMMTPNGMYAVPLLDHQAYNHKVTPAPAQEPKPEIPEDLICNICSDLLTDAVMIPCCGNSFCDECIRGVLLESEEHECPDCHDKDISPDTLIPNRFIRTSVAKFKNTTGYVKKPVYREPKYLDKSNAPEKSHTPPPESESTKKPDAEQKTVISEADSTEHSKSDSNVDFSKDIDISEPSKNAEEGSTPERPPGVSPRDSPKDRARRHSTSRESKERSSRHSKRRDDSPRRSSNHRRSPNYESRHEERSGTPTIDEPTAGGNFGSSPTYNSAPPGTVTSMIGHIQTMQGPPQTIPNTYPIPGQPIGTFPPTQGPPPPNFRLPPPGSAPPPYMAPGSYPIPPRPMFEGNRPPIGGLPPNFNPNFPPGSRSHRDFNRRIRDRTPPGLIDDPLAAFNRMLREKDEQKRRAKRLRRSYSRSRSRSRSFSRSPIRRRSRSPRPLNRRSRSRSRSFSLSRSRQQNDRHRDRDYDDDRDYNRGDSRRNRNVRDRQSRDRDRFYDKYEERSTVPPSRSQQPAWQSRNIPDNYYPPNVPQGYPTNRFPQGPNRDYVGAPYNQPFPQTIHSIQPPQQRQYQDIRPPGVDDDLAPPGVDEPPAKPMESKESPKKEERDKYDKRATERRDRSSDRKRRYEKRSRTPDKARNPSPKRKSKDRDTPERHRRKRRDSSDDRDKKVDHSDEEKSRKSKDKKKHKDKKESEKKRKRDRKDKHKKDVKEKKVKEEFKQVIPKKSNEEDTDDNCDTEVIKRCLEEKRREDKKSDIKERMSDKLVFPDRDEIKVLVEENTNEDPVKEEEPESPLKLEIKSDLYGDISEDIDPHVIETYGKLNDSFALPLENDELADDAIEEGEIKEYDEEEKDVLELHTNDIDLKAELEKPDILAPVPEKSKWEVEDDMQTSPKDSHKSDSKSDKSGKVTNEVLKRAENAIFAKAINAIRPIEIKKISLDRAKLYSGEREDDIKIQPTVASTAVEVKKEVQQPPRLSVKDRLGVKVDDPDKIINLTGRHRSRTMSPFSRRSESGRNYGVGERRVEVDDLKSRDRNSGSRSYRRDHSRDYRKLDMRHHSRGESRRSERKKEVKREEKKHEDTRKSKRKLSRSRSNSDERKDKHKKKEKKQKRDKSKKSKEEDSDEKIEKEEKESKPAATTKRKPTIDEANFEPDYDLESHTEEEEDKDKKIKKHSEENADVKKSSSSETESESSSEEDRKKKKHKKRKKRRRRETSSSSSSESESDSSDSDKERRRKKHKKNKKKKKKSKHKS